VLVRWLVEPKSLSREQTRVLRGAVQRGEPLAISAITLLEIATLFGKASKRQPAPAQEILVAVDANAGFQVVPFDVEIATELVALGDALRDPGDRAIVATARVHRLRLVTSDRRIIESKLVAVVE
jgi:PIN domain nuclease of toxin-antitoxin system